MVAAFVRPVTRPIEGGGRVHYRWRRRDPVTRRVPGRSETTEEIIAVPIAVRSWRVFSMLCLSLLAIAGIGSARAGLSRTAQSAASPAPAKCLEAPRPIAEIERLAASALAASPTPDGDSGTPADADTVDAITQTVAEAVACANANDPLRVFALFTDRYVAERFGPAHPDDLGSLEAAVSRPPSPADEADRLTLVGVRDAVLLADGRAEAIVVTENAAGRDVDRLDFAQVGDRWLIDGWEPVESSAATPETGA
jgi:hypothetical protein